MKIIKISNIVKCDRCSTLFEIEKSDVMHTHSMKGNTHDFVTCLCCNFHIRLSSEVFTKENYGK